MRRTLLWLGLAAAFAACGSDEEGEPIPQDVASAIETQLNAIQGRVAAEEPGACADIEENDNSGTFAEIERQLASLPGDVDADVADALRQSVDRLEELVDERCTEIAAEPEPTPEPTETIEVPTIPEATPPPTTEPEETVPEEPLPPNDGGDEQPPSDDAPDGDGGGAPAPEGDG